MQFVARHRNAPISDRKTRLVVDMIRGKHVNDALNVLRATPKRAAYYVDKVLRSAVANADQSLEADMESLRVARAWVDGGPMRKKWHPRARGRVANDTRTQAPASAKPAFPKGSEVLNHG